MAIADKTDKIKAGLNGKRRTGKLPSKKGINLAIVGQKKVNYKLFLPALIIVTAAVILFGKFMVIDRLTAVSEAQNRVTALQNQLDACYAEIDSYGDLNDTYAHYTYSGFTEEELTRTSRVKVLKLIRTKVLNNCTLDSWALSGNELTLIVSGNNLQEINKLAQIIQDDETVNYCTVNTANTGDNLLNSEALDLVSARVLVYLNPEAE